MDTGVNIQCKHHFQKNIMGQGSDVQFLKRKCVSNIWGLFPIVATDWEPLPFLATLMSGDHCLTTTLLQKGVIATESDVLLSLSLNFGSKSRSVAMPACASRVARKACGLKVGRHQGEGQEPLDSVSSKDLNLALGGIHMRLSYDAHCQYIDTPQARLIPPTAPLCLLQHGKPLKNTLL